MLPRRIYGSFLLLGSLLAASIACRSSGAPGLMSQQGPTIALRTAATPEVRSVVDQTMEQTGSAPESPERKVRGVRQRPDFDPQRPFSLHR